MPLSSSLSCELKFSRNWSASEDVNSAFVVWKVRRNLSALMEESCCRMMSDSALASSALFSCKRSKMLQILICR